ncbi:MAG TPA: serine--tRNA ligase [Candidatus Omnitrophota bacterium]|nr:serine--tRNA ligase [Candidatus Omnitrophota bacterium]HPD85651.1 serine--tRNA ligase [Candidatus Omnitrophota bacterium]HRZ04494.1 serine--tRNA ligase [Candidatus Omnitrophota bacterium]
MLDLKFIRDNSEVVRRALIARNIDNIDLDGLLALDDKRRKFMHELETLRSKKNTANDEITKILKEKKDPKEKIAAMKTIAAKIDDLETKVKELDPQIESVLIRIPNIPHLSVPVGAPDKNKEVRRWGELKTFDFKPKNHIEIAESLDIIDFKRATKITGSNFIVYKKDGARLERALYNFMLDIHTKEHGYTEILPPYLVNRASMTGTGQLPKMEEDMYKLKDEDYFLIPTAEVPVTNLHRDEVLKEEDLPILYTAYTACFRREAGSYGKDTRGLVRVHQFDKVELVKFVTPKASYDELEKLVGNAERILQIFNIPYRVILLASGDLSFASSKCYDLEGYAPGMDKWLEISSCSNFEDFQARRANIRYRGKDGKVNFVHTLNGSGVALARTMIALLENYQTKEGEVLIPEVLQPYMGGQKRITGSIK